MALHRLKYLFCITSLFIILGYTPELYGQKEIAAFIIQQPLTIDGTFEPLAWKNADSAINFIQMEPNNGSPSTQKTVAYFGYDSTNIYATFICYQTTDIVAKIQTRDKLSKNDDAIVLVIDTYSDNRSGYGFWVNPLGTQCEFKINDDGRNIDSNWDTEWECAAGLFDGGWCVEMSIPFTSIRYKKGLQQWGINFSRAYPTKSETTFWSGTLSDDFRISQGGVLTNISTPKSEMSLSLFPYGNLIYENSKFEDINHEFTPDIGGDIKWQVSSNLSMNATYNPDFATVEADEEKINLSRYELRYPEKRLFFQEGNEMYKTRIKTFYSRRIQDIDYGGKVTGKIGNYHVNILSAKSPTIPDEDEPEPEAVYTAARIKRDFLKSSSLGLTFVDKTWKGDFVRSVSADYVLNLGKTWKLTGQYVASFPGDIKTNSAGFVRFAKENNKYHFHIRYSDIGETFQDNVNQTGFITDDDRREVDSDLTYKWWMQNNVLKYIRVYSKNNIFWGHNDTLRSWYLTDGIKFYFQNRLSLEYALNNEYKLYEDEYYNYRHKFSIGYNTDEWSSAEVEYTFGRNFSRQFYLIEGETQFKLSEKLAIEFSSNYLHFDPDTTHSNTFINILSANYNFNKDLWIKVFAQNSTSNNKIYIYGMFGWRFKPPFGSLFLIYSHNELYMFDENRYIGKDVVFIKLTYPLHLLR